MGVLVFIQSPLGFTHPAAIEEALKAHLGPYYALNGNAEALFCNVIRKFSFQSKKQMEVSSEEVRRQLKIKPKGIFTVKATRLFQEVIEITLSVNSNPQQEVIIALNSKNEAIISIRDKAVKKVSIPTEVRYDGKCHFLSAVVSQYDAQRDAEAKKIVTLNEVLADLSKNEDLLISKAVGILNEANSQKLIPLGESYKEECKGGIIEYVSNADERNKRFKLEIINGTFMKNGKPYTSASAHSIFVVDSNLNLYEGIHILKARPPAKGRFYHSSFLAGAPVLMAGEIHIKDGKLLRISNKSGHYKPSEKSLSSFLEYLKIKRVNFSNVKVELEKSSEEK